jgi:hypothetical protein
MVVKFWPQTGVGIHPAILKAFEGDYDGDEIHLFPVYSEGSIAECERWHNTPNSTFDLAMEIYRGSQLPNKVFEGGHYMHNTTMSFQQMMEGMPAPIMAEQSRVRKEHIEAFANGMRNPKMVSDKFTVESIRGMSDINRQQLSQPVVGDMSRIARIVASCVHQQEDGTLGVLSLTGFIPVKQVLMDDSAGNAAVRGMSTICARAQQVALDSHRVQLSSMPSHDLIRDMIVGSDHTLVVLRNTPNASWRYNVGDIKWRYNSDGHDYVLCKPDFTKRLSPSIIVAAYNPVVLSYVSQHDRYDVCSRGISLVVNYYSIPLSVVELASLAVLFTYRVDTGSMVDGKYKICPITTRSGMVARDMQWLETVMATHYFGLTKKLEQGSLPISPPLSVSTCLMAANFMMAM